MRTSATVHEQHDRDDKKEIRKKKNEPHIRDEPVRVAVICEPGEGPLWSREGARQDKISMRESLTRKVGRVE